MKITNRYRLLAVFALYLSLVSCTGNGDRKELSIPTYTPPPVLAISKEEKRILQNELNQFFKSSLLRYSNSFSGGILVAKGGNILFEYYQGYEDLTNKTRPLTNSSALHIASTSKTFTGIAILQLIEKKKISLDDKLTTFFPGFPYPEVTIKMLMNHRSGIPNYLYFMDASSWDKTKMANNMDVLHVMLTEKPPRNAPPDARFEYSNTNYLLLALLIEKITGESYPNYMRTHFFEPLHMNSTYVYQPADSNHAISSYQYGGKKWPQDYLDNTYGDKNIYSTPRDLLKWDQALYTHQLINATLLDAAFTPYSFERRGTHNYGLGWRLELLPSGKKIIYHFGRWHGNNAAFTRLTDAKATIIILGNQFNRSVYSVAHHCYDIFGIYDQQLDREEE